MANSKPSSWASALVRGAITLIVLGLFIGGSAANRLRIASAIQKNGATTTGTVTEAFNRFYALPFIKYIYSVGGSTYEKEAALLGVADYEALRPGVPLQVSYVTSQPHTALPTIRTRIDQSELTASLLCGGTPLVLGLIMLLIVELTRPATR